MRAISSASFGYDRAIFAGIHSMQESFQSLYYNISYKDFCVGFRHLSDYMFEHLILCEGES